MIFYENGIDLVLDIKFNDTSFECGNNFFLLLTCFSLTKLFGCHAFQVEMFKWQKSKRFYSFIGGKQMHMHSHAADWLSYLKN